MVAKERELTSIQQSITTLHQVVNISDDNKAFLSIFESQNQKIGELIKLISDLTSENACMRFQLLRKPFSSSSTEPFEIFQRKVEKANKDDIKLRAFQNPFNEEPVERKILQRLKKHLSD